MNSPTCLAFSPLVDPVSALLEAKFERIFLCKTACDLPKIKKIP
jgi:hypothetical protein